MTIKINPPTNVNNMKQTKPLGENVAIHEEKKNFVKQANKHQPFGKTIIEENELNNELYPWNKPIVRKDVTRIFNLRLSEPDWLKLKYLADHTKESMHSICLDILIPTIHKKLKKLINQESS